MLLLTITLSIYWIKEKIVFKNRQPIDMIGIEIIHNAPKVITAWSIILAGFLFVGFSKLHILWVCPLTFFVLVNLIIIKKPGMPKKPKPRVT